MALGAPAARAHGESRCSCVSGDMMSVMFEPDAPQEHITGMSAEIITPLAFFAQGSRWNTTATNGPVSTGQAFTLTYSFVPDGTVINVAGQSVSASSNLLAVMDASFPGGRAAWKARFAQAFAQWSAHSNITFVEVGDDGAGFPASPGATGARGDIRIAMRPLEGSALAVNFFPQFGGDMVIDSNDIALFVKPDNDFRALRNMLIHEIGHGLGLQHVLPENGTKIMEPNLLTTVDGPQEDDIRGIQFVYGDRLESNDAITQSSFIGGPINASTIVGTQVLTVENVSLERAGASDFYSFTAFAGVPIAIRVEPVGTEYSFAPQSGGAVTSVNARGVRNLGLRLWRRTSAVANTFDLFAQIDFNPAGQREDHPPIVYAVAGFMVAEVFSSDGINDVQRYTLTISNAAIADPVEPSRIRVFDVVVAELEDGDTVAFSATTLGTSSTKTLTILNAGTGPLDLGPMSVQGPAALEYAFTLVGVAPVPTGATVSLAISFTPAAAGQRVAVLNIPNNDPERAGFSVIVSGTGVAVPPPPPPPPPPGNDCNGNGVADAIDLSNGVSADCNANAIPDECEADADQDGVMDECDNCPTTSNPDQADADANGLGDACDEPVIENNPADDEANVDDQQADEEVDEEAPEDAAEDEIEDTIQDAEDFADCNANGRDDLDDIDSGRSPDCNANDMPDECETDTDSDGVIDECDNCPAAPNPRQVDRNRNGIGDACENRNEPVQDDERDIEESEDDLVRGAPFCGMGTVGMIPFLMLGLCGLRSSTRRGKSCP